jgi:hypothetical protein
MKKKISSNKFSLILLILVILAITNIIKTNDLISEKINENSEKANNMIKSKKVLSQKVQKIKSLIKTLELKVKKDKKSIRKNSNKKTTSNGKQNKVTTPDISENPYKNTEILSDPNIDPVTLPFNLAGRNRNFLGLNVNAEIHLANPPFKITRCDQIVSFYAKFIVDNKDYFIREIGFVVINAHFLHLYTKDKKQLIDSILLSQSKVAPHEPRGAKRCLQIDGGSLSKNIIFCFAKNKSRDEIIKVLGRFSDCRSESTPTEDKDKIKFQISELKKDCDLLDSNENPLDLIKRYEEAKAQREKDMYSDDEIWHPHVLHVPGNTPEPDYL